MRGRRRKAQLLSVDFIVAVSLIAVCIGVLLQFNELAHSRADSAAFVADNKAEAIAALVAGGENVPANTGYCARRVLTDGSIQPVNGDCEEFSCGRGVFVSRRIEACVPSPTATPPAPSPPPVACVLEVRTC